MSAAPNIIHVIGDNAQVWSGRLCRQAGWDVTDLHRFGVSNNCMREMPSAQVSHVTLPELAPTFQVGKCSLTQIMC